MKQKIFLIPFAFMLLWSCSVTQTQKPAVSETVIPSPVNTAIPTATLFSETYTPTTTPTQTSTPVPTLVAHEWTPIEPLISFGGFGGDGGCGLLDALPIRFTLLSNGELYILDWNSNSRTYEIKSSTLSRQSTCKLLNSIDQAGFFDYDPDTYISDPEHWYPPVMGAGHTYISVQAWRSKSVSLSGLGDFVDGVDEIKEAWGCPNCPPLAFPTILPSLRKTYHLLANYKVENLGIYQSDRLGLWVDTRYIDDAKSTDKINWPLKSVKLSKIIFPDTHEDNKPNAVLTGTNAKAIYQLFNQNIIQCGIFVTEDNKVYRVFARPLLPNEYLSETPKPSAVLSCSPADGWVEVP